MLPWRSPLGLLFFLVGRAIALEDPYVARREAKSLIEPSLRYDVSPTDLSELRHGSGLLLALLTPWCGNCAALKSTLPEAARLSAQLGAVATIATMDASSKANQRFAARLGPQVYPLIVYYDTVGTLELYEGGRDEEAIARCELSIAFVSESPL